MCVTVMSFNTIHVEEKLLENVLNSCLKRRARLWSIHILDTQVVTDVCSLMLIDAQHCA